MIYILTRDKHFIYEVDNKNISYLLGPLGYIFVKPKMYKNVNNINTSKHETKNLIIIMILLFISIIILNIFNNKFTNLENNRIFFIVTFLIVLITSIYLHCKYLIKYNKYLKSNIDLEDYEFYDSEKHGSFVYNSQFSLIFYLLIFKTIVIFIEIVILFTLYLSLFGKIDFMYLYGAALAPTPLISYFNIASII